MELDAFGLVWYVTIFCFYLGTENNPLNQLGQGPHLNKIGGYQKGHQTIRIGQLGKESLPGSEATTLYAT